MRRRRSLVASALVLALGLAVAGSGAAQLKPLAKEPEVPYVPTDERVVAEMLKVAKVGKNDVLYDLGSGDGRIVITAAKQFGTRGVGVDIDPARITEARENAVKAGVTDRVRFVQQDLFETDIREATVVTLYLLPEVNLRLRPKLLGDLKPGTRVVSHNYDMGDWKPLRTLTVNVPEEHTIYFWVVPPRSAR
jgi:SAM-dependent methyltransferase